MKKFHIPFLTHSGLWARLFILLGTLAIGMLVATLCSGIALFVSGNLTTSFATSASTLRLLQFIQSVSIFILPSLMMAYFISAKPWQYLSLTRMPKLSQIILTIISMVLMVPFMNGIIEWNESIKLPEFMAPIEHWMREKEDLANQTIELILTTSSWGTRIVNLLLVGVTAAISEELFFRGILQNIFLDKWHKRLLAVLLSAFIFSAIHLQFYGFVPRFLLGAYFGLLLVWTGNLWLPILAHFINNSAALIQFYIEQSDKGNELLQVAEKVDAPTPVEWLLIGSSFLLFVYTALLIKKSGT